MSRYRKIEVSTWSDRRFRELSPMPVSGQGLWFFLLTGPHTGPIPGLFRAGRAGMAEELGWDTEGFDKAFGEVLSQGMAKADFKARLVWLPNAIKHNKPESPNVVRSWRAEFELLPECDLKNEAIESIGAFVCALGEGYAKAFEEAFGKPSRKTIPNQEQEQEQEQEKREPREPAGIAPPFGDEKSESAGQPSKGRKVTFATFCKACKDRNETLLTDYEPLWSYAESVGIETEWIEVAWWRFKARYLHDANNSQKRYIDWRQVFLNACRDNWFKLWALPSGSDAAPLLTSNGELALRDFRSAPQKVTA